MPPATGVVCVIFAWDRRTWIWTRNHLPVLSCAHSCVFADNALRFVWSLPAPGRWAQWSPHPGSSLLPLKLEVSAPPLSALALECVKLSLSVKHLPVCVFLCRSLEPCSGRACNPFLFLFFQLISPAWKSFNKVKGTLNPRNYLERSMARPSSVLWCVHHARYTRNPQPVTALMGQRPALNITPDCSRHHTVNFCKNKCPFLVDHNFHLT